MSKNILIGVTGSIAAIKIPFLVQLLISNNYKVKVILTKDALSIITPNSLLAFKAEVYTEDNNYNLETIMNHITLAKWAELILICPATLNTISKITYGIADNLLLNTIVASKSKIAVIPAMNKNMWESSINTENIKKLEKRDILIWGPQQGIQACGDNGLGRMIEVDSIIDNINKLFIKNSNIYGKNILISLGATKEPIDPVRYISNNSSGKMGYAIAKAAQEMGANIILIRANVNYEISNAKIIDVVTANEMHDAVMGNISCADMYISVAAIADYSIKNQFKNKLKKSIDNLSIELTPNIDILSKVGELKKEKYPNLYVIGFAAETQNLLQNAQNKLVKKNLDMIIANDVSNNLIGFGSDNNEVYIIKKSNMHNITHVTFDSKINIAKRILLSI